MIGEFASLRALARYFDPKFLLGRIFLPSLATPIEKSAIRYSELAPLFMELEDDVRRGDH